MYISEFLDYLSFEKRYSQHTVISYKTDLEQFFSFLRENVFYNSLNEISHLQIRAWIVALSDSGTSATSINRKLSALKTFYKFLLSRGFVNVNPLLKIVAPKTSKKLPVFVNSEDLNKELNTLNELYPEFDFKELSAFLILELLYNTGMRLSELINLKDSDFDFYNEQIKVLGKRKKERIIPISGHLKELIKYYQGKKQPFAQSDTLLVLENGKKYYPEKVYHIVKEKLSHISTISKKSPHILRHTFATHMLNNGADLNSIKELLGHANLAATQIYTHNSIDKLKKTFKLAHPKA